MVLVKLVAEDTINRGLKMESGLNCVAGIYYYDGIHIGQWISKDYTQHMCTVTVPEDARTVALEFKYRSDKVILSNSCPIADHPIWKDQKICKLAVQHAGCALRYVEQTDELCKLAVQQNGWALEFVEEQTDELCKLAVQQDGRALEFVKEQTGELCKLAVQQNGRALEFVEEQTGELCKLAVQQNGLALEFVDEQTEEICKLAVQQRVWSSHCLS
jgi:hypothetical protein